MAHRHIWKSRVGYVPRMTTGMFVERTPYYQLNSEAARVMALRRRGYRVVVLPCSDPYCQAHRNDVSTLTREREG